MLTHIILKVKSVTILYLWKLYFYFSPYSMQPVCSELLLMYDVSTVTVHFGIL
jgi:hypothetical protein